MCWRIINNRSWYTMKTNTCALHSLICVARYGSIFSIAFCSSQPRGIYSPVTSEELHYQAERSIPVPNVVLFPCALFFYSPLSQLIGSFWSDQVHETHSCDTRLCPSICELCKRLCDKPHLHGLAQGTHHLCGLVVSLYRSIIETEPFIWIENHINALNYAHIKVSVILKQHPTLPLPEDIKRSCIPK